MRSSHDHLHTLPDSNWLHDILHFTSSHQRFILKFVNTIPLPLKYSSALIQASHSICRSLILCWISKILFTGAHLTYSDALSRRSNIFPLCIDIFTTVSAAAWRLSWRPQVRWRCPVVEPHPGPGPPFSGATIHQHRAPGTLATTGQSAYQ